MWKGLWSGSVGAGRNRKWGDLGAGTDEKQKRKSKKLGRKQKTNENKRKIKGKAVKDTANETPANEDLRSGNVERWA